MSTHEPWRWYDIFITLPVFYFCVRYPWALYERWRYNRTHRRKVFLVQRFDVPAYSIEFFLLPYYAVRWVRRRRAGAKE